MVRIVRYNRNNQRNEQIVLNPKKKQLGHIGTPGHNCNKLTVKAQVFVTYTSIWRSSIMCDIVFV